MKKYLLLFMVVMFSGCGYVGTLDATVTGYSEICVEGVAYIQFASGATAAYTRDGKIKLCGNDNVEVIRKSEIYSI